MFSGACSWPGCLRPPSSGCRTGPPALSRNGCCCCDTVAQRHEPPSFGTRWRNICARCRAWRAVALAGWPLLERKQLERFRFGERSASQRGSGLLSGCLARLGGHDENSFRRRQRLPSRRDDARRGDRQRNFRQGRFSRARIPLDSRSRRTARPARCKVVGVVRDAPLSQRAASPFCRRSTFRFRQGRHAWAHWSRCAAARFIVRTAAANPHGAGIHPTPRSAARAARSFASTTFARRRNLVRAQTVRERAAGHAGAVLRGGSTVARGCWPVWRAGLFRAATAARDWHSHGDRRASRQHRAAGDGGDLRHGAGGSARRRCAGHGIGAIHRGAALSSEAWRTGHAGCSRRCTILAAALLAALPAVFHAVRIDPVAMLRSE